MGVFNPRAYQTHLSQAVDAAHAKPGVNNVAAVLATGGGKTVIFSKKIQSAKCDSVAIAHRKELVVQMSAALAREEVPHKVIGPKQLVKDCVAAHMEKVGRSYYEPSAHAAAISVDTLVARKDDRVLRAWAESIGLWVQDECHHVLRGNKWGTACDFFPNAKGLGVTATPCRADGKGLGRSADGVFDEMVIGPPMRDLINLGYLTDYRVISARTQDLNLENVGKGKNGDYSQPQLKKAARKSRLVGDAVDAYLKYTPGKLAVVFATDLESADDLALKFKGAGVAAAVVSANSTNAERAAATAAFARREIKVLINVDLFGEGYDLPAIEVVIMARPTESFGLYCQQFGRALRLMISRLLMDNWESFTPEERRHYIATSEKPKAIIIDHVGNVVRHGLPDAPRAWSLDGGPESNRRGTATDAIPLRTCLNEACLKVYERSKVFCPYCGHTPVPTQRSKPEHVEGDLFELDEETLARMRGEVFDPQKPFYTPQGIGQVAEYAARQRHARKAQAHEALTASIGWWAQIQRDRGIHDRESHKKFWHLFGVDVLTARNKNLSANDAIMLAEKINQQMVRELSKCS